MRTAYLAITAAIFLAAGPAAAAVHFNLTGVVTSGFDNGFIGPGFEAPFRSDTIGINLATGATIGTATGRSFSLAITFDPSHAVRNDHTNGREYEGFNASSPGTATFTMNGITYEIGSAADSSAASSLDKVNGPTEDRFAGSFLSTRDRPLISGPFTQFSGNLFFALPLPMTTFDSLDLDEPFSWTGSSGDSSGELQITLQNTDGAADRVVVGPSRSADLFLRFDSLTATVDPSAVPEPSGWAMMILGLGLVGAAVRRRARAAGLLAV